MLQEQKRNFYTFSPKGQKPYAAIITGLSDSYDEADLRAHLAGTKLSLEILRIAKLGWGKWLIHLSRKSDIAGLYKLQAILGCIVKITRDKKKKTAQCFNCQRFGHVANNCGMPYRCVKCGGDHGPAKCKIPSKGQFTPKKVITTDPATGAVVEKPEFEVHCINCKTDGHTASSKNCPKRLAFIAKRVTATKASAKVARAVPVREIPSPQATSTARSGVSYAAATAIKPSVSRPRVNPSNFNVMDVFNKDSQEFFGMDFFAIIEIMKKHASDYNSLSTKEAKRNAMLAVAQSIAFNV